MPGKSSVLAAVKEKAKKVSLRAVCGTNTNIFVGKTECGSNLRSGYDCMQLYTVQIEALAPAALGKQTPGSLRYNEGRSS